MQATGYLIKKAFLNISWFEYVFNYQLLFKRKKGVYSYPIKPFAGVREYSHSISFMPGRSEWDNQFKAYIPAHIVNALALPGYRNLLTVVGQEVLCKV